MTDATEPTEEQRAFARRLLTDYLNFGSTNAPQLGPDSIDAVEEEFVSRIVAARDSRLRAEQAEQVTELKALILALNEALGGIDEDAEHIIDCHADQLPEYARTLERAVRAAHAIINDEVLAMVEREPAPMKLTRERDEARAALANSKALFEELCEYVAQMCERFGDKRDEVPCDAWRLRDNIIRAESRIEKANAALDALAPFVAAFEAVSTVDASEFPLGVLDKFDAAYEAYDALPKELRAELVKRARERAEVKGDGNHE